jgi:hypothetical protein
MVVKFNGYNAAKGYWGRSPWERIECEQTAAKIRVLESDEVLARGVQVFLYLPVISTTPGAIPCTCVKDGNSVADRPCESCYGTKFIPGYHRFQSETLFAASAQYASFTLTNVVLDTTKKPNRLALIPSAVTGTIITPDQPYTNPAGLDWETRVNEYVRDPGNTVLTEFSTNAGGTYTNITAINGVNKPTGTGNIRFRVTLTRAAITDKSPVFEIVRIRRVLAENVNPQILTARPDFKPGRILILRTWVQERASSDVGRGLNVDWVSDGSWTLPLDFFDITLTHDTPPCKIDDLDPGTHPFMQHDYGIRSGERLVMTQFNYNEALGLFTRQAFQERRAQANESYGLVF